MFQADHPFSQHDCFPGLPFLFFPPLDGRSPLFSTLSCRTGLPPPLDRSPPFSLQAAVFFHLIADSLFFFFFVRFTAGVVSPCGRGFLFFSLLFCAPPPPLSKFFCPPSCFGIVRSFLFAGLPPNCAWFGRSFQVRLSLKNPQPPTPRFFFVPFVGATSFPPAPLISLC